ncbi:MAG TPA: ACT domain-containing protein [Bacillota bacterium]
MGLDTDYYVIKTAVLPEILRKTIMAKELLQQQKVATVNDAVQKVGMSRSVFYKYRDHIFPFYEFNRGRIVTLGLTLEDRPGVLSSLLDRIARAGGNILTINQNIPIHGTANLTLSVRTANLRGGPEGLFRGLEKSDGVQKVEILAQE